MGGRELRRLLLDALEGCDDAVLAPLGPFASWQALHTLWQSGWLGARHPSPRATHAEIRQRLRHIAEARRSIADAVAGVVCVEGGVIRASVEALLIDDNSGEPALIPLDGVRWIGRPRAAAEGDRVTVLGFADAELDATLPPSAPRRLPRRVAIRAAGLPVIAHLAMRVAAR